MSELISGKEALIALANGAEVEYKTTDNAGSKWHQAKMLTVNTIMNFDDACILFRLKPRTITINGVEYIDKQGAYEAFMEVYNEMDIHPDI